MNTIYRICHHAGDKVREVGAGSLTRRAISTWDAAICEVDSSQGGWVEEWVGGECRQVHPRSHAAGKAPKEAKG